MVLIRLTIDSDARLEFLFHIWATRSCKERGHPIFMRHDFVDDLPFLDLARPADHCRNAEATFPVCILLTPERRNRSVGPCVVVRAVVCGIHHDGVVSDAQFIEVIEQFTDHHVVANHSVVVKTLTGETTLIVRGVGKEVHSRGVVPDKEWLTLINSTGHEIEGGQLKLAINGLHSLTRQCARIDNVTVRKAVNNATWREELYEQFIVVWIVGIFGLFFCV